MTPKQGKKSKPAKASPHDEFKSLSAKIDSRMPSYQTVIGKDTPAGISGPTQPEREPTKDVFIDPFADIEQGGATTTDA
jgi:hypothetical protein